MDRALGQYDPHRYLQLVINRQPGYRQETSKTNPTQTKLLHNQTFQKHKKINKNKNKHKNQNKNKKKKQKKKKTNTKKKKKKKNNKKKKKKKKKKKNKK